MPWDTSAAMTRKNWTLLVVAAAQGRPKALFLLGRNLGPEQLQTADFYAFEPCAHAALSAHFRRWGAWKGNRMSIALQV